jgi:hypothetical protein
VSGDARIAPQEGRLAPTAHVDVRPKKRTRELLEGGFDRLHQPIPHGRAARRTEQGLTRTTKPI